MWNTAAYQPIIDLLDKHEIPDRYPDTVRIDSFIGKGLDMGYMVIRDEITRRSGYAALAWEWLQPLSQWIGSRKCLEVMGGCGSLSKCLQDSGVSVICTDSYGWQNQAPTWYSEPWTTVEKIDAVSAIEKYGSTVDFVICSWPYRDDACHQALLAMRKVNPKAVMLFIGEPPGATSGATANEAFFETAILISNEDFERAIAGYVTCYLLHDRPMLFR